MTSRDIEGQDRDPNMFGALSPVEHSRCSILLNKPYFGSLYANYVVKSLLQTNNYSVM